MSNNIEEKPEVTLSGTHRQPVAPYVLDFIKFFGGFVLIVSIALIVIHIVSVTVS